MAQIQYVVGSNAFFSQIPGFEPHDKDILVVDDEPQGYKDFRWFRLLRPEPMCVFQWRQMPKDEFIDVTLMHDDPLLAGKFLVPEFAEGIGLAVEDLARLDSLFKNMGKRHLYEKVIYAAYMENGNFSLTSEQLKAAYDAYLEGREM